MNSYRVYWKEQGKLCRVDVTDVYNVRAALAAVKDHLAANDVPPHVLRRVFAVVK